MNAAKDKPQFGRRDADWEENLILFPIKPDMHHIAAQLAAVAASLAEIVSNGEPLRNIQGAEPAAPLPDQLTPHELIREAHLAYELRRKREAIFAGLELFGEPAWDMLLDLYGAHVKGQLVSVSSACIASAGPATTALRWLGTLQQAGLVERTSDPQDQRRVLVRLTRKGIQQMEIYLREAAAQRSA